MTTVTIKRCDCQVVQLKVEWYRFKVRQEVVPLDIVWMECVKIRQIYLA